MVTAIQQIEAQLAEVFAGMDAKVKMDNRVWGTKRRDAIKAKAEELKNERRKMGEWAYYEEMFKVAGGKTWYGLLYTANDAQVVEIMDKNSDAVAKKRNMSISNKLVKSDITEVLESSFAHTKDGFDGTFVVMTDKGKKVVSVNTIYAGGYNIQCLHLRVLVKVK